MENMDKKYNKSLLLILLICLIFTLVIGSAYQYIPEKTNSRVNVNSQVTSNDVVKEDVQQDEVSEDTQQNDNENNLSEKTSSKSENPSDLEEISVDADSVEVDKTRIDTNINKPKTLEEYLDLAEKTTDEKVRADAYENISLLYAAQKRYGTSLAYAQKAYNISKTVSREVLLARLYYKLGYTEKANRFVDSFLRKDFSLDN